MCSKSSVFNLSSQSKLELGRKRGTNIVKMLIKIMTTIFSSHNFMDTISFVKMMSLRKRLLKATQSALGPR